MPSCFLGVFLNIEIVFLSRPLNEKIELCFLSFYLLLFYFLYSLNIFQEQGKLILFTFSYFTFLSIIKSEYEPDPLENLKEKKRQRDKSNDAGKSKSESDAKVKEEAKKKESSDNEEDDSTEELSRENKGATGRKTSQISMKTNCFNC